ncbi:lipoprotein [Streptomyces sp. NPDC086787]|uniref:lipoprotein n=1 Tax=Streptomyces sp. NPDC086787 TaxID=3365759 RepID=UPI00380F19AF
MRITKGTARAGLAPVLLLAGALSGCAEPADGDAKPSATASATAGGSRGTDTEATEVAKSGGTIGAAHSACELPVAFGTAEGWKAKAVRAGKAGSDGDLADALLRQGPVTLACEIDAKPAGNIGFLRAWTGSPGGADARGVLRAFVAAEKNTKEARYRPFTAGGLSGVEVDYLYTTKLLDETKKESAFAVVTPDGPVVVHLGGMDTEEHEAMLPAYELAKRTLRLA